jgi:hypothetical protein
MYVKVNKGSGGRWYASRVGEEFELWSPLNCAVLTVLDGDSIRYIDRDDCEPIDRTVDAIIKRFKSRSTVGIAKYSMTMDRNDLKASEWAKHLQEELMDSVLYMERLIEQLKDIEDFTKKREL